MFKRSWLYPAGIGIIAGSLFMALILALYLATPFPRAFAEAIPGSLAGALMIAVAFLLDHFNPAPRQVRHTYPDGTKLFY